MIPPEDDVKPGAPEWVVTFGDMMSLLLCFFVLLLSFSTMEVQKFKVVAGYVREAFGVQKKERTTEVPAGETIIADDFNPPSKSKEIIFEKIEEIVTKQQLEGRIEAEIVDEGVRIQIDGSMLFVSGSARLNEAASPFLDDIAGLMQETGASGIVEGHSDDRPIETPAFPSNWELSGARSGAVVRSLLERELPPSRLEAVAYADTKPRAGNETAEGRAKNRRVEMLLQPTE
jgi:chemotaxis protein MotB